MLTKVQRLSLGQARRRSDPVVFPGYFLYEAGQLIAGLPRCDVANTSFVVLRAQPYPLVQMVTEHEGLYFGWDVCGGCSLYMTKCTCVAGLTPPKWVQRGLRPAERVQAAPVELERPVPTPAPVRTLQRRSDRVERQAEPALDRAPTMAELNRAAEADAGSALDRLKKKLG